MNLELIAPKQSENGRKLLVPNLGLLTVAGLTPRDIEVSLTDENVDEINFDKEVDLVGITVMTHTAVRAFEISDTFRKKGKCVVLGGLHPSAMPEEAGQHADAVVIGEAEGVWQELLRDFESGKLRKFYRRKELADLANLSIPRRDLIKSESYRLCDTVETSRGCPFHCSFCSVSLFFGSTYRFRPVQDVINEVKPLTGKYLAIVDDNIAGHRGRAKELFKALAPYKKKWISQVTTSFTLDEELVKLAAQAGCVAMYIGYESLSPASLEEVGKSFNIIHRYKEGIKKMHDHGIIIHASFVFGFDHDDTSVFEQTVKFAIDARIDSASFTILTPNPGTPLYQKLLAENRLVSWDWWRRSSRKDTWCPPIAFKPKLMSIEELSEGLKWSLKEFYSGRSILKRLADPGRHWLIRLLVNLTYNRWARCL